MQTEHK